MGKNDPMTPFSSAIPTSELCYIANPDFWSYFCRIFSAKTGHGPVFSRWTEDEVAQWIDENEG